MAMDVVCHQKHDGQWFNGMHGQVHSHCRPELPYSPLGGAPLLAFTLCHV